MSGRGDGRAGPDCSPTECLAGGATILGRIRVTAPSGPDSVASSVSLASWLWSAVRAHSMGDPLEVRCSASRSPPSSVATETEVLPGAPSGVSSRSTTRRASGGRDRELHAGAQGHRQPIGGVLRWELAVEHGNAESSVNSYHFLEWLVFRPTRRQPQTRKALPVPPPRSGSLLRLRTRDRHYHSLFQQEGGAGQELESLVVGQLFPGAAAVQKGRQIPDVLLDPNRLVKLIGQGQEPVRAWLRAKGAAVGRSRGSVSNGRRLGASSTHPSQ